MYHDLEGTEAVLGASLTSVLNLADGSEGDKSAPRDGSDDGSDGESEDEESEEESQSQADSEVEAGDSDDEVDFQGVDPPTFSPAPLFASATTAVTSRAKLTTIPAGAPTS